LGNPKRYNDEINKTAGTFWYSQDFAERSDDPTGRFCSMGPIPDDDLSRQFTTFVAQYGRDNAEYLIDALGYWQKRYQRAAFIDAGVIQPNGYKDKLQNQATHHGWSFDILAGDLLILRDLLNGAWMNKDAKNFIVIPPDHTVDITYDKQIFRCTPG